ncbi:hypothetical protein [Comamonas koreensis]|uniref:Uncharacterized protein n=1 Tax=Comamonas koreensis TaxID=160825 RepID=A0AAW4XSY1_9BURK|nr:hypothetical protein [Comamonas koreensis]MCD2164660.1 hypothetical protein [Comamonas koreensis]
MARTAERNSGVLSDFLPEAMQCPWLAALKPVCAFAKAFSPVLPGIWRARFNFEVKKWQKA